jgi:hypothetical protein
MDYFCAAPGISLAWIFRKWIIFALRQEFHLPRFYIAEHVQQAQTIISTCIYLSNRSL